MRLVFRVHAIERMFRRRISEEDVRHVLTNGEEIESYPEDTPYPSRLVLGRRGSRRSTWSRRRTPKVAERSS